MVRDSAVSVSVGVMCVITAVAVLTNIYSAMCPDKVM